MSVDSQFQIGHIAKNCPSQKILVSNQKLDSQQSSIQKNPSSLHKKKSKFTLEEYVPDIKTVTSKYVDSHMHIEYLFQKLKTIGKEKYSLKHDFIHEFSIKKFSIH